VVEIADVVRSRATATGGEAVIALQRDLGPGVHRTEAVDVVDDAAVGDRRGGRRCVGRVGVVVDLAGNGIPFGAVHRQDRAGRGMAAVVRTGVGRRERRAVRIGTITGTERCHQLLSRAHDRAIAGAGRGLVAEDAVAGFLGVGLEPALWLAVGTVGLSERAVVAPAVVAHLDTDTDRIHLAGAHVGVRARVVGNGRDAATRLVPVTWPAHKVVGTDGPGARP